MNKYDGVAVHKFSMIKLEFIIRKYLLRLHATILVPRHPLKPICMGKNKQLRKEENRKAQVENNMRAVVEYEKRLEVIQDQINKISLKIATCQRDKRVSDLSRDYIQSVPETDSVARFYKGLGKSFLLGSREEIVEDLLNSANEAYEELPRLTKTFTQFETLKKEQLDSIKELHDSIKVPTLTS